MQTMYKEGLPSVTLFLYNRKETNFVTFYVLLFSLLYKNFNLCEEFFSFSPKTFESLKTEKEKIFSVLVQYESYKNQKQTYFKCEFFFFVKNS